MSEDKGKPFVFPTQFDPTVCGFRRFEKRSGVKVFEVIANAAKGSVANADKPKTEGEETEEGIDFLKGIFSTAHNLCAFIYECGLSDEERREISYEDWTKQFTILELMVQLPVALRALFPSSPTQKDEPSEPGKTTKATEAAETKPTV